MIHKETSLQLKLNLAAKEARKLTKQFAYDHRSIGDPVSLECYCAIGSYILWKLCKSKYKLDSVVFCNGYFNSEPIGNEKIDDAEINHCWARYRDRYIIDITATQFNVFDGEIYMGKVANNRYYNEYKSGPKAFAEVKKWGNQAASYHISYLSKLLHSHY